MAFRRKGLTQKEIEAILFNSDSDDSDIDIEENFSDNDTSVLCPTVNTESDSEASDNEDETENDNESLTWSLFTGISNDQRNRFDGTPGPNHTLLPGSSEIDYFKLLLNDEMIDEIRQNTNKYAEFVAVKKKKSDGDWRPIEDNYEMWAFISILLIMSLVRMSQLRDYWSSNEILGHEMIKKIMPRNRFFKLLQYFHVSDKEKELGRDHPDFNIFQKLEPLNEKLKINYRKSFHPYKEMAVDEALIKYKGRLGIVQYMPLKPAKRGIKVWMLCTSYLGYVYNFNIYGGKNDAVERTKNGLGYDVVMNLIQTLNEKQHTLYFDRFFTSVKLLRDLLKKEIYACGTVLKNRKQLPEGVKNLQLKTQGESFVYQCNEESKLLCSTWMDKKQISILSTNVNNNIVQVKRRKGKEINDVNCPESFKLYNQYMGGVDLADQRRKYYTVARKSMKWWYYLFWFLLDTTIVNSFIIMSVTNFPVVKKPPTLRDFKLKLIEQLVKDFSTRKRASTVREGFYEHNHLRKKICGSKRTCIKCRKNDIKTKLGHSVQSSWECDVCKICLCKNCF